ncbi:MAG: M28 family metallopeptidase [Oscillochloridaceae bacterium]|nr:M28 family metallopeptidase [Chloroflexaceae bacterium]MDW8389720.1 M28 family metallopeptidase [Oscillochloridaceae bacterium]
MTHIEHELNRHLIHLSRTIGARPAGSAANVAAAGYIARSLESAGFTVELQAYQCPTWEDLGTTLEVGGVAAPVGANPFSPPCDVQAPAVAAGALAELQTLPMGGRVAVLYGQVAAAPLAPGSWPWRGEHDSAILTALEKGAPEAVLMVQTHAGALARLIEDPDFPLASATVSAEAGLLLVRQPGVPVRLRINTRRGIGGACNVIGRLGGQDEPRVLLCAHFDTKIDTPGASDNAGGVAVLLALAEMLGAHQLSIGLEVVAFNGGEYPPSGAAEYIRQSSADLEAVVAVLNFDGVGQWLAPNSIALIAGSPAFAEVLQQVLRRYPGVVRAAPWLESDHGFFAQRGVPAVAFSAAARQPLEHTRADTADWVSPPRLREAAMLGAEIVAALRGKSPAWSRPPRGIESVAP